MSTQGERWRRCSSCKKDIGFTARYWRCNVSTCNRKRTGTVFCTVSCWEAHVPIMNHRESWAVEEVSPTPEAWRREQAEATAKVTPKREPRRTIARPAVVKEGPSEVSPLWSAAPERPPESQIPKDILIVTSKLKQYIKAVSGMNTSDAVTNILSDHVRALCDRAIEEARRSERKTVMERDYPEPKA